MGFGATLIPMIRGIAAAAQGWVVAALCLSACLGPDRSELTAVAATAQAGPDCATCHPYPIDDDRHRLHLINVSSNPLVNGPDVTCLDCHARSMAHRDTLLLDSIFVDSIGNELPSLLYPYYDNLRNFALLRVDSVWQHRPVRSPVRAGDPPAYQEYLTALAHMNGKVDVDLDEKLSDTARFQGQPASYNPEQKSCSAIACHSRDNAYRWERRRPF
jgi:hypothetical protein